MMKPEDIPQDIWDSAASAERTRTSIELGWDEADVSLDPEYIEPIARAIMAERGRCSDLVGHAADRVTGSIAGSPFVLLPAMALLDLQEAIQKGRAA